MKSSTCRVAAAVTLVVGIIPSMPAWATSDWKSIDAMACQPYGPDTTSAELIYNQLGVSNPGTTNESVMCPISADADTAWVSTPGLSGIIDVYFRTGATLAQGDARRTVPRGAVGY